MGLISKLFATEQFQPHAYCLNWKSEPGIYWTTLLSNLLIGLAYVAISLTLVYLVHRGRRDIPFHRMFLAFGLFIIACGCTHFMDVITLQHPVYGFSALVLVVTAAASVATAIALPGLVPLAINLISAARLSEERRVDVERAHSDLEGLYQRTLELENLKTQFFANVSHELRTPLTLILGPVSTLLSDGALNVSERKSLEVVQRNARSLLDHVNDLLDLSKMDAGKMVPDYSRVDLSQLIRMTASHFDSAVQDRKISFSLDVPLAAPAEIDPEKVQRILTNLLSNAFKFVPPAGAVKCSLHIHDGRAIIQFQDNGPGVPASMRKAIFERFSQGDLKPHLAGGGTGLGLAISQDFTELHGGFIRVDDAPGGGALFTVDIPTIAPVGSIVATVPPESAETSSMRGWQPVPSPDGNQRATFGATEFEPGAMAKTSLVLVVEDNADVSQFVAETLAEYRVAVAFDGLEGIQKAVELRPDLIISDVMLPGATGAEMVRQLRTLHPGLDDTAVLMLTAKADDELRINLLRNGAQDYMMKPFSPDELRVRVKNLLSIKRAREVLQVEAQSHLQDVELLAREVVVRRRETQEALEWMERERDHAERVSQVKSHFLALVSHELRTPITIIRSYLYLLERDRNKMSVDQQQRLGKLSNASTRLSGLIDSLLEYTRLQSDQLVTHPEAFDLLDTASVVAEEIQLEYPPRLIRVAVLDQCPPIFSDKRLVRLALQSLVANAVKHSNDGPVEVTIAYANNLHQVSIKDFGPGIPRDQQPRVFEAFQQGEELWHKHTPGIGLGLAIVKAVVDNLGGSIKLDSEENTGSTFTLTLPSMPANDTQAGVGRRENLGRLAEAPQ
ncbi:MAG: ATP-binding protein [Armatimonadota bacterium]|nr:ATP-binding protein [Armatimonadota bacterium]